MQRFKIPIMCVLMLLGGMWHSAAAQNNTGLFANPTGSTLEDVFRITLEYNFDIHIQQQQLKVQQANVMATKSPFDLSLVANSASGFKPNFVASNTKSTTPSVASLQNGIWSSSVGVTKLFKNGMRITPNFDFYHNSYLTAGTAPTVSSNFGVTVVQPLMRGRGTNMASAALEAESFNLKAQELHVTQTQSQALYQSLSAYWQFVAAYKNMMILREAEARAHRLYQQSDTLVQRKELPASNLDQLLANWSAQKANRIVSEQQYLEARIRLGLSMGLESAQIDGVPKPILDFPTVNEIENPLQIRAKLVEIGLKEREDLKRFDQILEADKVMLVANRQELRPQLDMQVDVQVKGYNAGRNVFAYLPPIGQNSAEASQFMVSFNYKIPFQNRQAQSAVQRQEAMSLQQQLQRVDAERSIRGDILSAFNAIRSSIAENQSVGDSKDAFERAIRNEQMKFKLGMATLVDVLTVEQNYTNAKLNHVGAQLKYTQALLRLHYETGTLFQEGYPIVEQLKRLETLPTTEN